jgi:NAD(P)-dependent dehydrogenase (short-subunit alcohol dehydrogenase family)
MSPITATFGEFLKGRTALVTGGTSGIGAAIARGLAAAGAQVTVTGVSQAEVDAARTAPGFGSQQAEVLDVREDAAVKSLVGGFDHLHLLVNCAGAIRRGAEHDPEVFEQVVDINLNGTMRCCVAARPLLQRSGGAIVNIASMLSFFGGATVPGYAASKGGVARGHVSDEITRLRAARQSHASRPTFNPPSPGRRGARTR